MDPFSLVFQLNVGGLVLEIIGFIFMIGAEAKVTQKEGGFSGPVLVNSKTQEPIKDTQILIRPNLYRIGIIMIIIGLTVQIFALLFS